jgi:gluconolactonase
MIGAWVRKRALFAGVCLILAATFANATESEVPVGPANATLDLTTEEGVAALHGEWRTTDARIIEVDFVAPGQDNKPGDRKIRTYDYTPHAGERDFDDSSWERIGPATLAERRSTGKVCFNWYRLRVKIPERIHEFDPEGATVVFETIVDDYAEVWVDGALPRTLGQSGGSVVAGFNVPNRLVIGRHVVPGQEIQLAIFGMNGPISDAPSNYIWIRSAKLDFYKDPRTIRPREVALQVERLDPAIDEIVPRSSKLEKIAEGFLFGEGPIWVPEGYLLLSDPNGNRIYKWSPQDGVSIFRRESGYSGADLAQYSQPGSNGLTFDPNGRLTICEHGNRRVTRLEKNGGLTILADRYEGKRLNSPNDLVYRSDGALFFTDPPFGLPKFHEDPSKELEFSGVFLLKDGELRLSSRDLTGPNGLAFSPDERYLYVANWDPEAKIVMRYEARGNGELRNGHVFFDMGEAPEPEALDGLKVDSEGNVYVSGPGGVWILSEKGVHLGTIRSPELPANFAWGDEDARTLYMAARTGLYRMKLGVAGIRPTSGRLASSRSSFTEIHR